MPISRRNLLAGVAATTAAGVVVADPAAAVSAGRRIEAGTGTDFSARLSPDRRLIAIDLVGVLWVLPSSGGPARRLTGDLFDIAQPDWSPDSRTIAFQSYREGSFGIWIIRPDGGGLRRLTEGPYDYREPRWAPDGRRLVVSSDRGGSYGLHLLDPGDGTLTPLVEGPGQEYEPAWSPDGSKVAFVVDNTRIDVVTLASGVRETAVTVPTGRIIHAPEWTPDGRDLTHNVSGLGVSELWRGTTPVVTGRDVFPFRVSWRSATEFLYTADGEIRRSAGGRIGFVAPLSVTRPSYRRRQRDFDSPRPRPVRGIGSPALSADGTTLAFRALNDIYLMPIGRPPRPLTRDQWWKSDPAFSPDGRYLSYSTDRGGKLDIWLRDLATGEDRQLTRRPNAAAVSGTWSRDSRWLAFLDQTGALWTVEVATGTTRPLFTATFEPGKPTWSADGRTIALAAIVPYSARYREGLSKILLVDVATGAGRYVDPLPARSIQTRGDDGPVWSPDGTHLAFVVASVLWVVPVRPDGTFAGPARQITSEVTDAPVWTADSRGLIYLHNGTFRRVSASGGRPAPVPMPLTWTNSQSRGRTVIRAGRLWDGTSRRLDQDVAVVVEGHRVVEVTPWREGLDGRLIDGRDAVVIPGLIDMHHHREMQGYSYGARQGRLWLSLGVTTTRSPGSPAYHMVEERESIQSGARLGPRYFGTGEAVDGPRIYYNFMRPTFDPAQLALELERAGALDYDLMKAYVRLPPVWQKRVIDWAHRHGVPATSHYHYPALNFGGDQMEHVGATSRFGYSRTVTTLGAAYPEVRQLFVAAGARLTPTLFNAAVLLIEDDALATDPRVRALYPPWEYTALQAQIAAGRVTDQTPARQNLARQVAHLTELIRAGGHVVNGTDSPIASNGISTHLNLRAMVRYGMTTHEALTTATRAAGEFLAEPLGRIAPGYYADLTILNGDPLTDIEAAADVRAVVANGVLHDVPSLIEPFASAPLTEKSVPAPVRRVDDPHWWHDPHWVVSGRDACCAQSS
ncbi:amidohydrolase family protein [Actinoplanes sp. NPDC089786]|uniref:amidohydrolase family protein n=1 Tax=Actinoplanes sp. NPDC089786 TaxID=3155185 RepID=UPI003436F59D